MYLLVSLVVTITTIIYRTRVLIRKTIIKAWSWKCRSSSITGEAASWNPSCEGCAIKLLSLRYAGL